MRLGIPVLQGGEDVNKAYLKDHDHNLVEAGIAAAVSLGLDSEVVEAAVAEGTERWL